MESSTPLKTARPAGMLARVIEGAARGRYKIEDVEWQAAEQVK